MWNSDLHCAVQTPKGAHSQARYVYRWSGRGSLCEMHKSFVCSDGMQGSRTFEAEFANLHARVPTTSKYEIQISYILPDLQRSRKKILTALHATCVHTTHSFREAGRGPNALLESTATSLRIPRRSRRALAKSLSQNFEHGAYRPQPV